MAYQATTPSALGWRPGWLTLAAGTGTACPAALVRLTVIQPDTWHWRPETFVSSRSATRVVPAVRSGCSVRVAFVCAGRQAAATTGGGTLAEEPLARVRGIGVVSSE